MARYAQILDGRVVVVVDQPDTIPHLVIPATDEADAVYEDRPATAADFFHPDAGFVLASAEVEPSWSYQDGAFAPVEPEPPSAVDLVAYAAAARYAVETGGVIVGGTSVRTDRESQGLIAGALLRAQMNGAATFRFKTPNGFVTLTGSQMQGIAVAVGEHVQSCFATEADVLAAIEAGEITTTQEIDAAFAA